MKRSVRPLANADLEQIRGGMFSSQGARGGTLQFRNGNSIQVRPWGTTISLNNGTSTHVTNTLNTVGAGAAFNPVAGSVAGAGAAVMGQMNRGNGVQITIPHGIPGLFITPRR